MEVHLKIREKKTLTKDKQSWIGGEKFWKWKDKEKKMREKEKNERNLTGEKSKGIKCKLFTDVNIHGGVLYVLFPPMPVFGITN